VLPEWINRNLADNTFPANGDYPLSFVSHSRGSLHSVRADLLLKLNRPTEARHHFEQAAALTQNTRERALLLSRAAACQTK
jgi:hypothetical protein